MNFTFSTSRAAISCLLAAVLVLPLAGATRPQYGGTAKVQLREAPLGLDPLKATPGADTRDRLAMLIFDRLTRVDEYGRIQPALAAEWQQITQQIWQFRLRSGAKLHDGAELKVSQVILALERANPDWTIEIAGAGDSLRITSPDAALPSLLALPRNSVVVQGSKGELIGSGAYKVQQFEPGRRVMLKAFDEHWAGKPYIENYEIALGAVARDPGADMIETRNLAESRAKRSKASELMALVFVRAGDAQSTRSFVTEDARVREALTLAIDRNAIHSVLLQKQGLPAYGLLPQWLTGYETLLTSAPDRARARKLVQEARAVRPIALAYEAGDLVAQSVAERIAADAREVGLTVQPFAERSVNVGIDVRSSAEVLLIRNKLIAPDPAAALYQRAISLGLTAPRLASSKLEDVFAAEEESLGGFRVFPILHLPEMHAVSMRVRNWPDDSPAPPPFADLWLAQPEGSGK